jgi:hypothetical protein
MINTATPAGLCKADNPPSSENDFRRIPEEEWPIPDALEENSAGIAVINIVYLLFLSVCAIILLV